jgi:hypothetical protein
MKEKYFKYVLSLSWIILIIGTVVDILTENTLDPLLREYIQKQSESYQFSYVEIIVFFVLFASLIASYIGLYLWKKWARILFISTFIAGYFLTPFYPEPSISSLWADDIYSIAYIINGIAIGMMFFSNEIVNKFKNNV